MDGALDVIPDVVDRAQQSFCDVAMVRIDAGFPSAALLAGFDARNIDCVSRLKANRVLANRVLANRVLDRLAEPHMVRPVDRRPATPRTRLRELRYQAESWQAESQVRPAMVVPVNVAPNPQSERAQTTKTHKPGPKTRFGEYPGLMVRSAALRIR